MTTKEAIKILERLQEPEAWEPQISEDAYTALQMAIDALGSDNNVGSKDGDLISRAAVIEKVNAWTYDMRDPEDSWAAEHEIKSLPSAQPEPCEDCVSRKAVIRLLHSGYHGKSMIEEVKELPSAHQTLYGYDIEHLKLIANVLQKENLPPERVAEVLMDIGRIVEIVRNEFEETLRKSFEQCMDFAVGEERRTDD